MTLKDKNTNIFFISCFVTLFVGGLLRPVCSDLPVWVGGGANQPLGPHPWHHFWPPWEDRPQCHQVSGWEGTNFVAWLWKNMILASISCALKQIFCITPYMHSGHPEMHMYCDPCEDSKILSVCPYLPPRNHLSFVNISPTIVIDTSINRKLIMET